MLETSSRLCDPCHGHGLGLDLCLDPDLGLAMLASWGPVQAMRRYQSSQAAAAIELAVVIVTAIEIARRLVSCATEIEIAIQR